MQLNAEEKNMNYKFKFQTCNRKQKSHKACKIFTF